MNQKEKETLDIEQNFKDIIENEIVDKNLKILDIKYCGDIKSDLKENSIDNKLFIVALEKREKGPDGKMKALYFRRYYLGDKCIGADLGDDNPILKQENEKLITQFKTSKEKSLNELENEKLEDVLEEQPEQEKTNETKDTKDKKNKQKEYIKSKNIQKVDLDRKVDSKNSLGERLDMKEYSDLYVLPSSKVKKLGLEKGNEINNTQYSLVAVSRDGSVHLVNNLFTVDSNSNKALENSSVKIRSNEMATNDNNDSLELRRKSNKAVLGMEKTPDDMKMFLYEKNISENKNVGIQIKTTETVKNEYVMNKNRGIYNAEKIDNETQEHFEEGCNPKDVRDYDGDFNTNTHEHEEIDENDYIPNTEITWGEFANACGYRGEGAIEKAVEEFEKKKIVMLEKSEVTNQEVIEEITEEKEEEYRGEYTINKPKND